MYNTNSFSFFLFTFLLSFLHLFSFILHCFYLPRDVYLPNSQERKIRKKMMPSSRYIAMMRPRNQKIIPPKGGKGKKIKAQ
ncbi:hypothetical protein F5X96DRAFT_640487 [Biscogniauxia mediterranea]|nr:hypothetical protein F5X96DRAFT_640487 [Biscogniauxia mediterranea]